MSSHSPGNDDVEQLILDYLPVVGYVVSEFVATLPMSIDRADLASVGHIALVRAAREFDPTRGVPFRRYVNVRIRHAIQDELRRIDHLSRGARTRVRTFKDVENQLVHDLKRTPTDDEIAQVMGVSLEDVHLARHHASLRTVSLQDLQTAEMDLPFQIPDEGTSPEQAALDNEQLVYLRAGIESLPERLRFVVEGSFWSAMTDEDMGEQLGVTRSQVSRLRSEALRLLRDAMHASLDPELLEEPQTKEGGVAQRRRTAFYASVAARAAMANQLASMPTSHEAAQPAPAPALRVIDGGRKAA